jgi:hypothetical protein
MPIPFRCACGRSLRVKDELAGRKVKCPECGGVLTVPRPDREEEEEDLLPLEDAPEEKESRPDPDDMVQTAPRPARRPARDEDDEDEDDERSTRERVRRRAQRAEEREDRRREGDREQRRLLKQHRKESRRDAVRFGDAGSPSRGWLGGVNAGIVGGLVMILIAAVWFIAGLAAGIIFFYPPILAVIGVIAIIKGCVSR